MNKILKPLVSVLIPAFNHEKFVREAILSVVNQTYGYQNIQLIVTDDYSTDNTALILNELATEFKFKLIINKKNIGVCSSMNQMIAMAKGKYIVGFASDDVMVYDRIENQINILQKYPAIDILAGESIIIDKQGTALTNSNKSFNDSLIFFSFEDIFLSIKPRFASGTSIIKSELFKRIGTYDPNFKIEDLYFWLKASYNNAIIAKSNNKFMYYRLLNNSVSSDENFIDQEGSKILDIYKSHPKYNKAIQNREISTLSKWIFINKYMVIRRIISNPIIMLNKRIVKILIMLLMPNYLLKYKFPENYYRNEFR